MQQTITRSDYKRATSAKPGRYTVLAMIISGMFPAGCFAGWLFHPVWYSLAVMAIGGGIMLVWRLVEEDARAYIIRSHMEKSGEVDTRTVRPEVIVKSGNNAKRVRLGKYLLTYSQWHKLARILLQADGRFVRDVVSTAGAFPSITKNWPDIVKDFERLGMVQEGYLTGRGLAWFNNFITPVAPPTPTDFDFIEDF